MSSVLSHTTTTPTVQVISPSTSPARTTLSSSTEATYVDPENSAHAATEPVSNSSLAYPPPAHRSPGLTQQTSNINRFLGIREARPSASSTAVPTADLPPQYNLAARFDSFISPPNQSPNQNRRVQRPDGSRGSGRPSLSNEDHTLVGHGAPPPFGTAECPAPGYGEKSSAVTFSESLFRFGCESPFPSLILRSFCVFMFPHPIIHSITSQSN